MKFADWLMAHYHITVDHFIVRTDNAFKRKVHKEYMRVRINGI